ncbi:hypothetical protein AB0B28_04775 [Glycomyces sp. NPDC046736]|uniref:hypothetical protein n=1 Tax=Glycomyces sp. NPDC046736 TaxID=3155615 RepID=UPI00340A0B24
MHSPEPSRLNPADLPLLRELVATFDQAGPFTLAQSGFAVAEDWSGQEFAFAVKRLADAGHVEVRYRAGGFVHSVEGIAAEARQAISDAGTAESLDALDERLHALFEEAAHALEAEPDHPKAAHWRALFEADERTS